MKYMISYVLICMDELSEKIERLDICLNEIGFLTKVFETIYV